jgi:pimeloyl-ACP methyl ester carboxylesterase
MNAIRSMAFSLGIAAALSVAAPARADDDAIELRDMGSFHVGGRTVDITGKPIKEVLFSPGGVPAKVDLNGSYQVEQMYAQYFLVKNRHGSVPLLLWHGGGMTGVTYETTPDGRPGWLNYFIRKGWDVYNSDAVERGRSGWAMSPEIFKGEPVFLTTANPWERFRIGTGAGSYDPDPAKRKAPANTAFPVEAYDQLTKQFVPRWTTTDDATLAAYIALVDKVCPCVILFHSQAGLFGFKAAAARPDKVRALVAVEPAAIGSDADAVALKGIPTVMLYGDFIESDSRWPTIRANGVGFAAKIRAAGGSVDVVDLPKVGITGNDHFSMMDRNNMQVADLIQKWLADHALWK